mgnify:CR=1 FL=1
MDKRVLKFKGNWAIEQFQDNKDELIIILKKRLNRDSITINPQLAQDLIDGVKE